VKAAVAVVFALLLAGCATNNPGKDLSPGMSMAEVEAAVDKPKDTLVDSAGRTVWFYPTAPSEPRRTWAVRFAPDGRVQSVEQRLTRENISRIVRGMNKSQVRELLGPPWKAYQLQRLPYEEWDYRVTTDLDNDLLIRFTADGVVHEVSLLHDPKYDRGP
jgi:outer membrane protein assembly factor BamE (lipoprotein component of BamABCDE complex)